MILEVAILNIKSGQEAAFEQAFAEAQSIFVGRQGYLSHQLQKCLENKSRYILLVKWSSLEDHTEGFRKSPEYEEWRAACIIFTSPSLKLSTTGLCTSKIRTMRTMRKTILSSELPTGRTHQ